jgi:hypothetical protein
LSSRTPIQNANSASLAGSLRRAQSTRINLCA